jgi:DNA-binding response OmpR family regulator
MSVEAPALRRDQRVLVVDDDHESRLLLSSIMAQAGFRVDAVEDGSMALTMMQSQPPDLVLLDLVLPRMDGLAVCRAIKADPKRGRTPVVMISARGGHEARSESMAAGADEFVAKPYRIEHLLDLVDQLIKIRDDAAQLDIDPGSVAGVL